MIPYLKQTARRLRRDESGATAVEYGIIASLFILALIPALQELSGAAYDRRSAIYCARRIMQVTAAGQEKKLDRIMSERGGCRRFI